MECYVVAIESGCTDHGSAYVFDSVWSDYELASEYCKKRYKEWYYEIEKVQIDKPS